MTFRESTVKKAKVNYYRPREIKLRPGAIPAFFFAGGIAVFWPFFVAHCLIYRLKIKAGFAIGWRGTGPFSAPRRGPSIFNRVVVAHDVKREARTKRLVRPGLPLYVVKLLHEHNRAPGFNRA